MSDEQPAELSKFQRKLAEREAAKAALEALSKVGVEFPEDIIPEQQYVKSEADVALDNAVASIDIIDAYIKYCGKMLPVVRPGQKDGIKISCPVPGHRDANPSAWINVEKQTWYCGGCAIGGDAHDLAAIAKGYPWPGNYKSGKQFTELRKSMAEDFGYAAVKMPGGGVIIATPETADSIPPENSDPSESDITDTPLIAPVATAKQTQEPAESDKKPDGDSIETAEVYDIYYSEDDTIVFPEIKWREIIPENTYLHTYMEQTSVDDVPEEFHFWHALLGLGFALGRDVRLRDAVPVYGNLFVCTLGRSGSGKSKARYLLDTLLTEALPHKWEDANSKGVRKISSPGSAEVMIHNFQKPIADPVNPKVIAYYAPVRGLVDYNELSSLVGRANRMGSVLKPAMMQLYDCEKQVSTSSLTHGAKIAEQPFASALTSSQPRALKGLVSNADDSSGFLNRWVFVLGTTKKKFAIGGVVVDMTPAVAPLTEILGWASTFRTDEYVEWSNEAEELFTDFFHKRIEVDKERSENDLIVRIDLTMKKLILLLSANKKERTVSGDTVTEAIHLYDYMCAGYDVPATQMSVTLVSELQNIIIQIAERHNRTVNKGVTLRQISKALWRKNYSQEMIVRTVESLVKVGMLEMTTSQGKGRPTVRYRYVAS